MKKWMKRKNYTAQSKKHLRDKNLQEAAKVLSLMEVDDAVDVWTRSMMQRKSRLWICSLRMPEMISR